MNPYTVVQQKLQLNADHQGMHGWLFAILKLGSALSVNVSGNAVDRLLEDLRTRVGNTIPVQTLAAELNDLRERIERGQA